MPRLRGTDLETVVDFLGDVAGLELDEPYCPDVLARLQEVIGCDEIAYQEYDYRARRSWLSVGIEPAGPYRWDAAAGDPEDSNDEIYWEVGPCQIVHYRVREGRLDAVRMSDVVSRRRFRESRIYREYFRTFGVAYILDLGLPERSPRQRSLILLRGEDTTDFSERDRAVLELLRPHLYHLEVHAALRRRLTEALQEQNGGRESGAYASLTPREREIVELVAEGKTNAEIAAKLWVSPSTVKKHLEHVYAKTGVGRRAAIVSARYAARS